MTFEQESAGDDERSAALEGWVAAFDDEMVQSGDFATSVAAMTTHGCFDVRAVVERWILANPSGEVSLVQTEQAHQEPVTLRLVPEDEHAPEEAAPQEPAGEAERMPLLPVPASSPDIAYFHSLLEGGIEREQICEAFPAFRLAIDEAFSKWEAAAPILPDVPLGPTREDLNDEIRGIRQELQTPGKRGRRRWRSRD